MRRDLPVAGKAGCHVQPLPFIGRVLGYLAGQRRARAYNAHIALEDVHQLRQLVDAGLADEMAHTGDARVILHLEHRAVHLVVLQQIVELALGVRAHGTKLVQPEQLAIAAHPPLAEDGA